MPPSKNMNRLEKEFKSKEITVTYETSRSRAIVRLFLFYVALKPESNNKAIQEDHFKIIISKIISSLQNKI
jgi:S-adenosylmethionine synthetase